MEHNFPCPITSDKDLNYYEDYLKKCGKAENSAEPVRKNSQDGYQMTIESSPQHGKGMMRRLSDTAYMPGFLKTMTGKLVRVESLIGGCLESRVGTLLQVGADYIVLKLYQSCSTMICESSSVRYITVIHDNDMNKIGLF